MSLKRKAEQITIDVAKEYKIEKPKGRSLCSIRLKKEDGAGKTIEVMKLFEDISGITYLKFEGKDNARVICANDHHCVSYGFKCEVIDNIGLPIFIRVNNLTRYIYNTYGRKWTIEDYHGFSHLFEFGHDTLYYFVEFLSGAYGNSNKHNQMAYIENVKHYEVSEEPKLTLVLNDFMDVLDVISRKKTKKLKKKSLLNIILENSKTVGVPIKKGVVLPNVRETIDKITGDELYDLSVLSNFTGLLSGEVMIDITENYIIVGSGKFVCNFSKIE